MNLHRSKTYPEWHGIATGSMNRFQLVAARTKGVITPGNVLTIIGFFIVLAGLIAVLSNQYWLGFGGIFAGRLFDIADGYAADKTGTKSPLGESLDAGFDKLITLCTLLVLGVTGVVSWWLLLSILSVNLEVAAIGALGLKRNQRLHPSKAGKMSMALVWLSLVGLILIKATNGSTLLAAICYGAGIVSVVLAMVALYEYISEYSAKSERS